MSVMKRYSQLELELSTEQRDRESLWLVLELYALCKSGVLFAVWTELGVSVHFKRTMLSDMERMTWKDAEAFVISELRRQPQQENLEAKFERERKQA